MTRGYHRILQIKRILEHRANGLNTSLLNIYLKKVTYMITSRRIMFNVRTKTHRLLRLRLRRLTLIARLSSTVLGLNLYLLRSLRTQRGANGINRHSMIIRLRNHRTRRKTVRQLANDLRHNSRLISQTRSNNSKLSLMTLTIGMRISSNAADQGQSRSNVNRRQRTDNDAIARTHLAHNRQKVKVRIRINTRSLNRITVSGSNTIRLKGLRRTIQNGQGIRQRTIIANNRRIFNITSTSGNTGIANGSRIRNNTSQLTKNDRTGDLFRAFLRLILVRNVTPVMCTPWASVDFSQFTPIAPTGSSTCEVDRRD